MRFVELQRETSLTKPLCPSHKGLRHTSWLCLVPGRDSIFAGKLVSVLPVVRKETGSQGASLSASRLDKRERNLSPVCYNLLSCGVQKHLLLPLLLMDLLYFMFQCLIMLLQDVWVWKPSGEALTGPIYCPCWLLGVQRLTRLSGSPRFSVENSYGNG